MRLDICNLAIARPIGVDHAQLIEITACAGKNDAADIWSCRYGERRKSRQGSWQLWVWNTNIPQVQVYRWDQQTQSNSGNHQNQSDRKTHTARGTFSRKDTPLGHN